MANFLAIHASKLQEVNKGPIYRVIVQKMKVFGLYFVFTCHFQVFTELVAHDSFCVGFERYQYGFH
jgi:hypothetical protein